jgi:putative FmdB family regulatory protein
MPVYDYRCTQCGTLYDVYHKVREVKEDVVCPSCHSKGHTKLMSVPGVSVNSKPADNSASCACDRGEECCGGACSMN